MFALIQGNLASMYFLAVLLSLPHTQVHALISI